MMIKKSELKKQRYVEGIGRRKTAVARVRIQPGSGEVVVNRIRPEVYFPVAASRKKILAPIEDLKITQKFDISVKVKGGGVHAQEEAVRHGLARALSLSDPTLKKKLRTFGYLTRDPRMVERKKYGLKKARRAPQWSKR